jgi:hypothetical protein
MGFVDANGAYTSLNKDYCLRSDTVLNVAVPAGVALGAGHFSINGISSPTFTVTDTQMPVLDAPSGTVQIGDLILLKGEFFNAPTQVSIDGTPAAQYTYWARIDSRTIALVIPPGTASNATYSITAAGGSVSAVSSLTIAGARPAPAITTSGNVFHDASGSVIQLRGVNVSALEDYAVQGYDAWLVSANPPRGFQANYAQLRSWGCNCVRLPLNEASWLGYWCKSGDGTVIDPAPFSDYRSAAIQAVADANSAGLAVILDLHWSAPSNTLPYGQIQMMDSDNSLRFWSDIAATFGGNNGVLFELYNEPYQDSAINTETLDLWSAWKSGAAASTYKAVQSRDTGNMTDTGISWSMAGMQTALDAIRGTGATNVCIVGGWNYCQDASGVLHNMPVDDAGHLAVAVHPYMPQGGSAFHSLPNAYPILDAISAAGYPIVATETGDFVLPGLIGSAFYERMYEDFDAKGFSYLAWTWDAWGLDQNVVIQTYAGRPAPGWGFYVLHKMQQMGGISYDGS